MREDDVEGEAKEEKKKLSRRRKFLNWNYLRFFSVREKNFLGKDEEDQVVE